MRIDDFFEKATKEVEKHRQRKKVFIHIHTDEKNQRVSFQSGLNKRLAFKLSNETEGSYLWFFPSENEFVLQHVSKIDPHQENTRMKYVEFARLVRKLRHFM